MKILYLCTDPGIELGGQGGGSIHIRAFVRALAQLGHEVTVVSSSATPDESAAAEMLAAVRTAPLSPANRRLAHATQRANQLVGRAGRQHPDLVRALHNVTFANSARAALHGGIPDFIYERYSLWGVAGLRLARSCGVPLVLEVNAPLVYEQQKYRGLTLPAFAARIERFIWRRADLVVCVSDALRECVERAGVPPERILVLPNGVDPGRFRLDPEQDSMRGRLALAGRFVIGLVGTFKPWHGTEVLLSAFERVHAVDPTTHLLLVGNGPLRRALEDGIRALGLERATTFTGDVPHRDVPRYLLAMDVAVLPYPALEQLYYSPLKLFEYMAAGRAIVAGRAGQVAQILVEGKTGLLFEPGSSGELAECILRLRRHPALAADLGENARAASAAHTWRSNARLLIEHMQRLFGGADPLVRRRPPGRRLQEHRPARGPAADGGVRPTG